MEVAHFVDFVPPKRAECRRGSEGGYAFHVHTTRHTSFLARRFSGHQLACRWSFRASSGGAVSQVSISSGFVRDDWHRFGVNGRHHIIRFSGQKSEQVVFRIALLHLSHRRPVCPDASEPREWSGVIEGKPDNRISLFARHRIKDVAGKFAAGDRAQILRPRISVSGKQRQPEDQAASFFLRLR
jgi:hypothetical protein